MGVPTSTWSVSTQQSRASMQVNMFTGEPHKFCYISCYETAKVGEYSVVGMGKSWEVIYTYTYERERRDSWNCSCNAEELTR